MGYYLIGLSNMENFPLFDQPKFVLTFLLRSCHQCLNFNWQHITPFLFQQENKILKATHYFGQGCLKLFLELCAKCKVKVKNEIEERTCINNLGLRKH